MDQQLLELTPPARVSKTMYYPIFFSSSIFPADFLFFIFCMQSLNKTWTWHSGGMSLPMSKLSHQLAHITLSNTPVFLCVSSSQFLWTLNTESTAPVYCDSQSRCRADSHQLSDTVQKWKGEQCGTNMQLNSHTHAWTGHTQALFRSYLSYACSWRPGQEAGKCTDP